MNLSKQQIEKALEKWAEEQENGTNTFSDFNEMTAEEKTNILFYYANEVLDKGKPKRFCKGCYDDVTKHMVCKCGEIPLKESQTYTKDELKHLNIEF